MNYGLSDKQLEQIISFIRSHPEIEQAVLFGSRVIDTFKEASDIDIAIKGEGVTAALAAKLKFDIEEDTYLPFFFDFVAYPTISNEALREHIDTKGIVIFRRGGSEWATSQFKDHFAIGLRNGLTKPSRVRGSGIPMVNMKEIFGYNVITDRTPMELVPITDKELETSSLEYNDLLFARQSLVESGAGKVSIFKGRRPTVFESHLIRCRIDQKKSDPNFIYYLFKSPIGKGTVSTIVQQVAAAGIKGSDLQNLEFSFPLLPEQKAIAAVLSSLDDKIDLLHRQNQTLERTAETLFRQWFVEEAGEDWEERPLSSIAKFLNGLACQKNPPKNDLEKLPVLKIRELSGGISESSDWATSEIKPEYIVEAGDVIFAWSASLMVKVWDGERCVLNQHLFKVTSDEFPKWFYLMWCKHHLAEFIAISASHATTMGHIKRGDLDAAMVLAPPPKVLSEMSVQMMPLLHKQIAIAKQRKTLEALRDSLLPKLMSGEVRVKLNT